MIDTAVKDKCRDFAHAIGYIILFLSESEKLEVSATMGHSVTEEQAGRVRAWCGIPEKTLYLFETTGETDESILWLTFHEIAHVLLDRAGLRGEIAAVNKNLERPGHAPFNDEAHDANLEEMICNAYATRMMGGECYDRKWLRQQQAELKIKEKP